MERGGVENTKKKGMAGERGGDFLTHYKADFIPDLDVAHVAQT